MSGRSRYSPENPRPHSRARYVWGAYPGDQPCRCDICRQANADAVKARKASIEPAYVGASRAREHVEFLATQGVGLKQIAKVSGVAHGTLWKLIYGVPSEGRPPSKRIKRDTETAILAVMPSQGADGSRVPADPVWCEVKVLLGRGWTKGAIARAIGQTGPGLQLGNQVVTRRHARAIHALLDEPVPTDVGKAWSAHHRANAEPEVQEEEAMNVRNARSRILLPLVELLEERIDQAEWRQHSACRGRPSYLFFPARGDHRMHAAAKKLCSACFVRDQCLTAHLFEPSGVYGGMSAIEREGLVLALDQQAVAS